MSGELLTFSSGPTESQIVVSPSQIKRSERVCAAHVCHHYVKILDCGLILYERTYCADIVRFFPFIPLHPTHTLDTLFISLGVLLLN